MGAKDSGCMLFEEHVSIGIAYFTNAKQSVQEVGHTMSIVQEVLNQLGRGQTGPYRGLLDSARDIANSNWKGVWIDVSDGSVWDEVEVASAGVDDYCVTEWYIVSIWSGVGTTAKINY